MAVNSVKIGRFQFQGGTSKEWADSNLILLENEPAFEQDTTRMKFGDGKTLYKDLPYITLGVVDAANLTDEAIEALTGPKGKDGKDLIVKSYSKDENGNIVLVLSDGTKTTLPKGEKGDEGKQGPPGKDGVDGKDGSDATVVAGTGLKKSGDTISVNTKYVATKQDLKSYAKATDIPKLVTLTPVSYTHLTLPTKA